MSNLRWLAVLLLAVSPTGNAAVASGLHVIGTTVTDDGDGDGIPDTKETVSLRLTVQNRTAAALSGVTAHLATDDDVLACLGVDTIAIGDLAPGEVKLTAPFVFSVRGDLDRATLGLGPLDDLSVSFDLTFSSASGPVPARPPVIGFDLDLDVSGGAGPTSFFETFENTLGQFEIDNMDAGLDSLAAADGWRCTSHDPDWVNSNSFGFPTVKATCYPGITPAHSAAVFWGLSGPAFSPQGGRAFTGFHSLFFGIDLGPPLNWTTPISVLEAARTTDPIALPADGESKLTFKHQINFVNEYPPFDYQGGFDRGVVMLQLAGDAGEPVGPWIKVHPYQNAYVDAPAAALANCMFDPIDDGNTEDDFFDPQDPARRLGPSSTCEPDPTFMELGDTSSPFHAANLGNADGPGLEGEWGIGTWVESAFDLGRFRGRQVRLRFLVTSVRINDVVDWEGSGQITNPTAEDDGWWIDDVEIDHVLTSPALVVVDAKDNSALAGSPGSDPDADGIPAPCDACPAVPSADNSDTDSDGSGNACDACPFEATGSAAADVDGDWMCEADNCPLAYNPDQWNADHDAFGLACDCVDTDALTYPGAPEQNDGIDNQCSGDLGHGVIDEVSGLAGFYDPHDKTRFSWTAQAGGAVRYQVAFAAKADYTAGCGFSTLPFNQLWYSVGAGGLLPPGQIRFYLVRVLQNKKGSWGQRSSGQERVVPCAP